MDVDDRAKGLTDLFEHQFSDVELRRWLARDFGPTIVNGLPGSGASHAQLSFVAAQLLIRNGRTSRFLYESLLRHVPAEAAKIRAIALLDDVVDLPEITEDERERLGQPDHAWRSYVVAGVVVAAMVALGVWVLGGFTAKTAENTREIGRALERQRLLEEAVHLDTLWSNLLDVLYTGANKDRNLGPCVDDGAMASIQVRAHAFRRLVEVFETLGEEIRLDRLCLAGPVDLRGVNLRGVRMAEADLSGLRADKADLSGARLRKANLTDAVFIGALLEGADLRGATLDGITVHDSTSMQWARLNDAHWRYDHETVETMFEDENPTPGMRVDLTGADVTGLTITGMRLRPPAESTIDHYVCVKKGEPTSALRKQLHDDYEIVPIGDDRRCAHLER